MSANQYLLTGSAAADYRMESGVLPEQVHPYSGRPLLVAPLTWSRGAYILAVINYLEKFRALPS